MSENTHTSFERLAFLADLNLNAEHAVIISGDADPLALSWYPEPHA